MTQVDDAISRIPEIQRKARNARNSLAPINKLPPETLTLVAEFFEYRRQLLNATAVCQYWRATLLSFPRLWNTIRCSRQIQFEAYLERSKSVLLDVELYNLFPRLFESLLPHTSRLAALTVQVSNSSDFGRIALHLQSPIPTLHKFTIISSGSDTLEPPSGIDYSTHVKELELEDISSFRAPRAFPHVTKLTWHVGPEHGAPVQLPGLLETLEQFPVLEEVDLIFRESRDTTTGTFLRAVTLPHVQRMSLHCSKDRKMGIPRILQFLKLPKLTSLLVYTEPKFASPFPALPITSFGEHLPNLAEFPEMEVYTNIRIGRVCFRSPSQAMLDYWVIAQSLGEATYHHHRRLWGGLPLHSVRRLTATVNVWAEGVEEVWPVRLLRELGSLEHLELEGYCGFALRRLRRLMLRRSILIGTKTLTVCSGTYDICQATRLRDVADDLGLGIVVTCTPAPDMLDTDEWPSDGGSEDWDLGADYEDEDGEQ